MRTLAVYVADASLPVEKTGRKTMTSPCAECGVNHHIGSMDVKVIGDRAYYICKRRKGLHDSFMKIQELKLYGVDHV